MTVSARERVYPADVERLLGEAGRRRVPAWSLSLAALGCLAVGAAVFLAGLFLAPGAAWGALAANFLFWTGVAQGGVVLAAVIVLAEARWGRVVQRFAAGLATFLPCALLVLALLPFGSGYLFSWTGIPNRSPWLSVGWLFARDALALAAMTVLGLAFLYHSVRPDLEPERAERPGNGAEAWATRGWRGAEAERERSARILRRLSGLVVVGFFLTGALLAIDLVMSLEQHYHSALVPVLYLAGSFYAAAALTAVVAACWSRLGGLDEILAPRYLLDLGNVVWGFSIFAGYLWLCRAFIIWMGNLPDEVAYYLTRWTLPWGVLTWTAFACAILIPALLLSSRTLKRHPLALAGICGIAAVGVLLEWCLEILPQVVPEINLVGVLVCAGVGVGFVGAVSLPYLWLLRRVPLFPTGDRLFHEALLTRKVRV